MTANKKPNFYALSLGLAFFLCGPVSSLFAATTPKKSELKNFIFAAANQVSPNTILNGMSSRTFEVISRDTQNEIYGVKEDPQDPESDYVVSSESVIALVKEILTEKEFKDFPQVYLRKMNRSYARYITRDYQFINIVPTNSTIYIDEDFLNTQPESVKKFLIRNALRHHLNDTYTKVRVADAVATSLAATATGKVGAFVFRQLGSLAKNALEYCSDVSSSPETPSAAWYSPTELAKSVGIGATKFAIATLIGGFVAKKLYNFFSTPTHDYLESTNNEFDKEALKKVEKPEDKKMLAKMLLSLNNPLLKKRVENAFERNIAKTAQEEVACAFNEAKREFDALKVEGNQQKITKFIDTINTRAKNAYFSAQELRNYIVQSVMADLRREFEIEKKKDKFNFLALSTEKMKKQYPLDELRVRIDTFMNNEVIPYYNSRISQESNSSWSSLLGKIWPWRR